jgi:hypothetical protein
VELIKKFLSYPNLFSGGHSSRSRTIAMANLEWGSSRYSYVTPNSVDDVRGVLNKNSAGVYTADNLLPSPAISWGRPAAELYFGNERNNINVTNTNTKISNVRTTDSGFYAKLHVDSMSNAASNVTSEQNRRPAAALASIDMRNTAFCSIPAVKEVFDDFVARFAAPWVENNSLEQLYVLSNDDLTDENCRKASSLLLMGWEAFTEPEVRATEFELKTFSATVLTPQGVSEEERFVVTPNKPIKVLPNETETRLEKNPHSLLRPIKGRGCFTINVEFKNLKDCKIGVMIAWRSIGLIDGYESRPRGNRGQTYLASINASCWIPEITGLTLMPVPKGSEPNDDITVFNGVSAISTVYNVSELVRVHDQSRKRTAKGGYRGAYQGIKTIDFEDPRGVPKRSTYCRIYHSSALSGIASGAPIGGSTYLALVGDSKRELPMGLETYLNLPRPEAIVKPIEIGHLYLYRIAEPTVRQVTADILSDMLLPSMPSLLLSVDSQIRVSSDSETYISGEQCYGPCDDANALDITLQPGLYTIKRKDKCSLGHDPGRSEYTLGFGDHCNETITIRRMLAQLCVHYDEFRGSFVGSNTDPTSTRDSSQASAASLLGRLS